MACYDCEDCPKNRIVNGERPCKQPFSYICPYNAIKHNLKYNNTLIKVLNSLKDAKKNIEEDRAEQWDMDEYYNKICSIINEIEEATDEKMIKEYKDLFNII